MKKIITVVLVGIVAYFLFPLLILMGIGWIMSLFSGEAAVSSFISDDDLDPERDSAWNGRDLNTIFDDSLGDWDLDGPRHEKF